MHSIARQKLDPFSFEHNFGKYCPILIILSLLQREINCDQVYPKIYHHTLNLLVHCLVKRTRMYWQTLLGWYHNKDVIVQTSHIECNMDKINIVTSQAVLEMPSFSMDTHLMSSSPLVNGLVKNRLFRPHQTSAVSIHPHYGFVCGRCELHESQIS